MSGREQIADVCLVVEGTYPFVRGGVAAWTDELIRAFPDLTFSIVYLGASRRDHGAVRYDVPPSVVHLETHFLGDAFDPHSEVNSRLGVGDLEPRVLESLVEALRHRGDVHGTKGIEDGLLDALSVEVGPNESPRRVDDRVWNTLRSDYFRRCDGASFVDYFWTLRTMQAPLRLVADIARRAPRARLVHALSTGYAGLLAALIARRTGAKLVLTEHGIYTKERKIDLNSAEWIPAPREGDERAGVGDHVRELWIELFECLGRITYSQADLIVSLYEGNRSRQVSDGANPEKTLVVPNGIDLDRFEPLRARRPAHVPQVVGFVGRLVPIKDVKTFIRAMRVVCDSLPDAEGWIVGGNEESPSYAEQCRALVRNLDLTGRVSFLGHRDVTEILPRLGVSMLTSISEAQPLTVLEAFAAGVPVVTTDVGACRELVEGRSPSDRSLGVAGQVVPSAMPEATASAAISLMTDEKRWRQAQTAGIARVRAFYGKHVMATQYRQIYESRMGG